MLSEERLIRALPFLLRYTIGKERPEEMTIPTKQRHFAGLSNFRDMGGYVTVDGRRMKRGILYRSEDLSRLTREDQQNLQHYGIRLICDLRTPQERKSKPARLPDAAQPQMVHIPIYPHENYSHWQVFAFLFGKSGAEGFDQYARTFYRRMLHEHRSQIREIFALLAEEEHWPALIHCTGGRDRTGFITALIQLVAGVPKAAVLEEYLLTNQYYAERMEKFIRLMRALTLYQVTPERMRHIMWVRREFLESVLDEMAQVWGTVENYLVEGCGIEREKLLDFRARLLEDTTDETDTKALVQTGR